MIFSKLLVLVLCCQIPAHFSSIFDCSFSNFCHPYESSWWERHADFCFHHCAEGKKYHCARDYDSPEVLREGCAVEKNCSAGEEPHLSFKESGKEVPDPVVYCKTCEDSDSYNWQTRPSSEYSECPDKKKNDCSKGKHKLLCKPDDSTDERYCRCDARNGYSPINDFSYEMCSYENYDCEDYNKCPDLPNGEPQQRLLNYTCAPYCDEGYDRLSEKSDDCQPVTTIMPTRKQTSANSTTPNISTTTSKPPVPTTTQKPGCVEECLDYSICYNGKCVCPDVCPAVYEHVCGYDPESKSYRTFPSNCDLERSYCKQKQFNFYSDGKCEPVSDKSNTKIIVGAVGGSLGLLLVSVVAFCLFYKSRAGRRCRDKFCPYPGPMEITVEPPIPVANTIVPTPAPVENTANTVVDGPQPNGRHLDRELSTLSAPSSNARKPPTTIIYKTTNIYQDSVVQTKGGNTQISMGGGSPGSKNKNVRMTYNRRDAKQGEDKPLLGDEVSETEFCREDSKSLSSSEDCNQENVPVVEHKADDITQPSENSRAEDVKDDSVVSSATGGDDTTKTSPTKEITNVEADSAEKLFTQHLREKETLGKSKSALFCRTTSMSHDSVLLPPAIQDIEGLFKDSDKYKELINTVMDRCLKCLLEDMEPKLMIDMFTVKEMFDHTIRRDINDMQTQTEKSRKIVKKVRETGKQYYHDFKVCLRDTNQYSCLDKVEKVQSDILAGMGMCAMEHVPKRCRHNSGSLPDLSRVPDIQCLKSELSVTKNDDNSGIIYKRAVGDIPEEKTSVHSENICPSFQEHERNPAANTPLVPSYDKPPPENRRPTYVPPDEETMEEKCQRLLQELSSILRVDRSVKTITTNDKYKMFAGMCEEIREMLPGLTAELLLPEQLRDSLQFPEEYHNTPPGFQPYRSSGKDNSCLYQTVSLLLIGSENLQYSLRLLATLHAVTSQGVYKKELQCCNFDAESLKLFFGRHVNEPTFDEIIQLDNADAIIDVCLKVLIMETACIGTDSSVLHVGFLSGALGMNIHQHFQQTSEYGTKLETVPWEKILQGELVNCDLPDLHIFWVNYKKHEKGHMNHIVPLIPRCNS